MNSLEEHKVYQIQKRRILKADELTKDVIAVGLQNLTAGEKNPLTEYCTITTICSVTRHMTL